MVMKAFLWTRGYRIILQIKKTWKTHGKFKCLHIAQNCYSSNVSGWYKRSYDETIGFLLLIKKIGSKLDKIISLLLFHNANTLFFFITHY